MDCTVSQALNINELVTPSPNIEESVTPSPNIEESVTPSPNIEESVTPSPNIEESVTPSPDINDPDTNLTNQTKNFRHNSNFASGLTPQIQNYLNSLKSSASLPLLRYGLSVFSSKFVFGENYQQILNSIYSTSLHKLAKSPNTMHNYGSENVITTEYFNILKSSLLEYIYEVYGIDLGKKCYLYTNFSVHYGNSFGYDYKLDEHVDDSEITINICLKNTQNYTGLKFNQVPDTLFSIKHNKSIIVDLDEGDILIHSGKQRHQVIQNISPNNGERVNLVLWLKFKY
jgi:hypothetical protein